MSTHAFPFYAFGTTLDPRPSSAWLPDGGHDEQFSTSASADGYSLDFDPGASDIYFNYPLATDVWDDYPQSSSSSSNLVSEPPADVWSRYEESFEDHGHQTAVADDDLVSGWSSSSSLSPHLYALPPGFYRAAAAPNPNAALDSLPLDSNRIPPNTADTDTDTGAIRTWIHQRRLASLPRIKKENPKRSDNWRAARRRNQNQKRRERRQARVQHELDASDSDDSDATVRASRSDNEDDEDDEDPAEDAFVTHLLSTLDDQVATFHRLRPANVVRIIERHPVQMLVFGANEAGDTITIHDDAGRIRTFYDCSPRAIKLLRDRRVCDATKYLSVWDNIPPSYYAEMKGMRLPRVVDVHLWVSGEAHAALWSQADFVLVLPALRSMMLAAPPGTTGDIVLARQKFQHFFTRVMAFAGPVEPLYYRVVVPERQDSTPANAAVLAHGHAALDPLFDLGSSYFLSIPCVTVVVVPEADESVDQHFLRTLAGGSAGHRAIDTG
ncbi:hypothetical protein EXIGLDRAFT_755620 [Exidia glandulosa HHB12029]|uniref:Uncharacterized protein n=1 Tax=Exidia glandulosa HHB12029 TaxID=1314781 RepID=A0A165BWH9_EXIGL|nr:hypothetical protein EXIGLDRAFT_755620 [Exidia glandulosa HHB12029]